MTDLISGPRNSANAERISVTSAAPFQPPRVAYHEPGLSLADIVAAAFADGRLDPAWEETLTIHVGDRQWPRELWATTRPKAGAIVALRGRAGWNFVAQAAWNLAIAFAVNAVVSAFTPKPKALSQEDPLFSLDAARNETAPYQSWPAVLGKHRIFPPHAAKHFTKAEGDKVYLYVLLGLGLAPLAMDSASIKIGDTPLSNYPAGSDAKLVNGGGWPMLFPPQSPDEQDGPGPIAQEDGWVAVVTDSSECDRIEWELSWPNGQVRIRSNGDLDSVAMAYALRYREVGATDWLDPETGLVAPEGHTYGDTIKTRKPFRRTHGANVATGQYELAVKRITEDYDNPNIITGFEWAKLRSFSEEIPVVDNDLALCAIKIEAGPHLNGVIDQINMVVQRVAEVWDNETETWGNAQATSNPAALARWVAIGPGAAIPYGGAEIDDGAFGAWFDACAFFDWRCDMDVRVGANMSLDEVLQAVAQCGRATLTMHEGKLTPVLDYLQPAATQLFTPRNSWGMRARRRYPPNAHAYRLEFNNEAKNYVRDEIVVPFPGYTEETAELIPTLQAVGKTRGVEVWHEGWRVIAETLIRGMDYSWRADWENLATARGRRVAFAHWEIAVGRVSARVRSIVLNDAGTHVTALELDEKVTQTLGEDYAVEWRTVSDDTGSGSPGFVVSTLGVTTVSGTSRRVELSASGGVPIASAPVAGDLVVFGDADIQVLDLVITDVQRATAFEAEISAVAYADLLFDGDQNAEPEWESNVSGDVFPAPPTPTITGVNATPAGIFVQFTFPTTEAFLVRGVEGYARDADDDADGFDLLWADSEQARVAIFPAGEYGQTFELKIVSISDTGRRSESTAVTVASATVDPNPVTLNFTPVATANITLGPRYLEKNLPPADDALIWSAGDEILWDDNDPLLWDATGWTDQVISAENFTNGAVALGVANATDKAVMFGLSANPSPIHFESIDYAWSLGADGKRRIYESGVLVWDNDGEPESYAVADAFSVSYDGAFVRYYVSGVLKHQTSAPQNLILHFDSAFNDAGARLDSVTFSGLSNAGDVVETRYTRSTAPPETPEGADPTDWSIAVPPGEGALWSITAKKTQSGALVGEWSVPALMTSPNWRGDYLYFATYYREDAVNFEGGSYKLKVAESAGNAPSGSAQENAYWSVLSAPGGVSLPPAGSGFTATIDLPSSSIGLNLYDIAIANGYDGQDDATIIFEVESGVTIQGLAGSGGAPGIGGGVAIDTGSWPTSAYTIDLTIRIKSGGKVYGGGGGGGRGSVGQTPGYAAGKGGDAIYCRLPIYVDIQVGGELKAGGGGGGGGGGVYQTVLGSVLLGGGGGGGGFPNGGGGPVGRGDDNSTAGASGTTSGGGANGAGGTSGAREAGGGGNGGGAGQPGQSGAPTQNPANQYAGGAPGAGGYAIRRNGTATTYDANGDVAGSVD